MNQPSGRKANLLFGLILVCAIPLYLFNITYSDLWIDETFTKEVIQQPFSRMFALLAGDFHLPLYFIGLKLFTAAVGLSDYALRLFSVLGALCTLLVVCFAGQRLFGKTGALYYCALLLALPMLASYAHESRMYTWAACFMTGVFCYAGLFLRDGKKRDLILLGLFTILAVYTHPYCLIAACWANLFVLAYLIIHHNIAWRAHLVMGLAVLLLFSPWSVHLLTQVKAVQKSFWIPPLTPWMAAACYLDPFAMKFQLTRLSITMIVLVYGLTLAAVYQVFMRRREPARDRQAKLIFGLALVIFNLTVLTGAAVSLTLKPILISRYMMTVVTMLMVPPALFFMSSGKKWLNGILLGTLLGLGLYLSIAASYFSYGPYRQSIDVMQTAYPEVKKVVHVSEVTLGPLLNYTPAGGPDHYWLDNGKAVYYTNLDAFKDLRRVKTMDEILKPGETFCLADLGNTPLNKENADWILSRSRLIKTEKVVDRKNQSGAIVLKILQYDGQTGPGKI